MFGDPWSDRRPHAHPDDALPRPRRRPAAAHVARTARVASGTSVHQSRDRPVGEPSRVAELLRSGVTTLCDMYFYENEVAVVVDELGMRGVLANAHFDVTSTTSADRTLAESEQFAAPLARSLPHCTGAGTTRALHRKSRSLPPRACARRAARYPRRYASG